MKYLWTSLVVFTVIISGCSNNEQMNEWKQENEQLKQENAMLVEKNEELEGTVKQLQEEINQLKQEVKSLEVSIKAYEKTFSHMGSKSDVLAETLSLFSLEEVQKGDQIGTLTVSEIRKNENNRGSTNFSIDFIGEFEVNGYITFNQVGGSKYTIMVEENLENLPHTMREFNKQKIYFNVINDEDLERAIGDPLKNLPMDEKLEITAVYKQYSYNYVPETDVSNTAEFVRLTSGK